MPSQKWIESHRQLKIWVTPAELDALRLAAKREDRSLTDLVRERLAPLLDPSSHTWTP